jgi:hypothetical protein
MSERWKRQATKNVGVRIPTPIWRVDEKAIVKTCVVGARIPREARESRRNVKSGNSRHLQLLGPLRWVCRSPWVAYALSAICERQSKKSPGSNLQNRHAEDTNE